MPAQEERLTEPQAPVARPRNRKSAAAAPKAPASPRLAQQRVARGAHDEDDDERGLDAHDADDGVVTNPASFDQEDRDLALFLDAMQDNILPDLPDIPGFHVCWLTTTNARDPVSRRLRAGYTLIRASDYPQYTDAAIKTGEYMGVLGVNEMVAAKIPERQFQRAMGVLHHERPYDEEAKIRARVESVKSDAARDGVPVVEVGDGTADLGKGPSQAPRFG